MELAHGTGKLQIPFMQNPMRLTEMAARDTFHCRSKYYAAFVE